MDANTLKSYIDQQLPDDFFRSLGFEKGRQGAMDYWSSNKADSLLGASVQGYEQLAEEYKKRYNEYDSKNPFNFDKVLEEESTKAGERLDPYYKQTLSDYLSGVNRKKQRSLEDERTLLTNLSEDIDTYQGNERVALEDTLERTRQGYADAGNYFSGARLRAEGQAMGESEKGLGTYLKGQERRQEEIQTTATRGREDLAEEQRQRQRDLGYFDPLTGDFKRGVEPTYQIKAQAYPEAQRREQLRQYEKNQFLGAPPGVNYADFSSFGNTLLTG